MKVRSVMKKVWLALIAVLLFAAVLIWWGGGASHTGGNDSPNVQPSETNVTYTKKQLETEMWRTDAVLRQYGIRVYGGAASVHNNAVKLFIDPRDKVRLDVTQEGVPNEHYYRLLRKSSAVPVYIAFEGPYVNPIGID